MTMQSPEKLPNILVIYSDQMRADVMGCAGNPVIKTPYLDRLAGEGARFANAFVSYPLCSPFRASFLTGKYAHANGMYSNHFPIDTRQTFLAPLLKKAGYRTGYIGKWHLDGGPKPGFVPPGERRLGFDHFVGFNRGHQYLQSVYYRDTDQPYHCARYEPDYQTDQIIDFMGSCLQQEEQTPFFAYICYGPPHFPMAMPDYLKNLYHPDEVVLPPGVLAPQQHIDMQRLRLEMDCAGDGNAMENSHAGDGRKAPGEAESEREIREFIAQYYGMVSNIDHNVGRILNWFDSAGIADDTLVIFMSDHGDMFGQHGHYCGVKRTAYRGSMQVPFIMRYPKRFAAGQTVSALVDVAVDTMPTLLELCSVAIPDEVQGKSYLPLLQGEAASTRDAVMYEIMRQSKGGRGDYTPVPERGIRTLKWLYVRKPERRKLLFDLENDPQELNNLIADTHYDALMAEFDRRIDEHMASTDDGWNLELDFPPPDFITHEDAAVRLENELLKKAVILP